MIIVMDRVAEIVNAVRELGGEVPAEVQNVCDAMDLARSELATTDPAQAVLAALDRGPLTAATISEAARIQSVNDTGREVERRVENALGQRFADLMLGDVGDRLIGSLRASFDAAAKAIGDLAYPVGTTAEALIDAGPKAIASWKSANQHRQVLEAIVNRVLVPLALECGIPSSGGQPPAAALIPFVTAAWLGDGRIYREVLASYQTHPESRDPAGRWHALGGALTLHSPAEAQQRFDENIGNVSFGLHPMPPLDPRGRPTLVEIV